MAWLKRLLARLHALWRAEYIHDEIDEELLFHIDMRTEENVRRGLRPEEARREAEHRFGRLTRIKELGYYVRGGGWLEALLQDLRFGLRMLLKNPGFTLVAVEIKARRVTPRTIRDLSIEITPFIHTAALNCQLSTMNYRAISRLPFLVPAGLTRNGQ